MNIARRRAGFTLLELLIVICIILVLSSLILTALKYARIRTLVSATKTQIKAIEVALQGYNQDQGYFPGARLKTVKAFDDLSAYMYAGLMNSTHIDCGGGRNSPYLDLDEDDIRIMAGEDRTWDSLSATEKEDLNFDSSGLELPDGFRYGDQSNQQAHPPCLPASASGSDGPLCVVDPWGNYIHYREWASKPESGKKSTAGDVTKQVYNRSTFDIWSNGPDQVNDWGQKGRTDDGREMDDINNWSN